MRNRNLALVIAFGSTLFAAAPAQAQDRSGIGVGVETILTNELAGPFAGPGIATMTYDTGVFQIGGMLLFISQDGGTDYIGAGGRFYYGIHRGERSDFSIGGGLALINESPDGGGDSETDFHLEGGGKIRAFITPNVAFTTAVGIGFIIADGGGDIFGLIGGLNGSVGVSYYFW